jgi:hypothetical protein
MPALRCVVVLGGLLLAVSCGHRVPSNAIRPARWWLTVQNHHWMDVEVYLVRGGQTERVGLVTATMEQRFVISTDLLANGPIQLLGHPVGGGGNIVSEWITVTGGETVEWTLERSLAHASLSIH